MRKLTTVRGLEIIRQGAQQFMALFEESACPFKTGTQDVERKLWTKGYVEARVRWYLKFEPRKPFAKKFVRPQRPFVKR